MPRHLKITCQIVGENGQTLPSPFTSFGVSVELPDEVQSLPSVPSFEALHEAADRIVVAAVR